MPPPPLEPGDGRIVTIRSGDAVQLSELACRFPLKLLAVDSSGAVSAAHSVNIENLDSAEMERTPVKHVYLLGYGGGLLASDRVRVDVQVGRDTGLALLTQGSTKVFRGKQSGKDSGTAQELSYRIDPKGTLFVLPEPVVPFRDSRFTQSQRVTFTGNENGKTGNLILLDWFTSGRASRGEKWEWDSFASRIEIYLSSHGSDDINEKLIFRDHTELSSESIDAPGPRCYAASLAPYPTHATFLLLGPAFQALSSLLLSEAWNAQFNHSRTPTAPELIWTVSELPRTCTRNKVSGCLVRIAGLETEHVRSFVTKILSEEAGGTLTRDGMQVFARLL